VFLCLKRLVTAFLKDVHGSAASCTRSRVKLKRTWYLSKRPENSVRSLLEELHTHSAETKEKESRGEVGAAAGARG